MTRGQQGVLAGIVLVVGILALAAGVVYLTVEARSLPSFMGRMHSFSGHRTLRGTVALIVGGVLVVIAGGLFAFRPRASRRRF